MCIANINYYFNVILLKILCVQDFFGGVGSRVCGIGVQGA